MKRTFNLPSTRKEQKHKEMAYQPILPDNKKAFLPHFRGNIEWHSASFKPEI